MRDRVLEFLSQLAIHKRRATIGVVLVITVFALGASSLLKMNFQWTQLLPQDLPMVEEFKRIDADFRSPGNYIVVLEGDDPIALEAATERAIEILGENEKWVALVQGKLPEEHLLKHGLRLAEPEQLEASLAMLSDPRLLPLLAGLNGALDHSAEAAELDGAETMRLAASLESLTFSLEASLNGAPAHVDRATRDLLIGNPYFKSMDGRMTLVMAAATVSMDAFDQLPLMDADLEQALAPVSTEFPGVSVGRTGMIPISRAEMESTTAGTALLTLLALVLVYLLLRWTFGDWTTPLLALAPVVVGIVWSMGFYALTIETLSLMTAMIMLVLIGLGIDFSIHLINRFSEERGRGEDLPRSIGETLRGTGRGVLTGTVTTAVAFFAILVSDSRGIQEFGFCAGTGVLLTLLAVFLLLPSLLVARELRREGRGRRVVANELRLVGSIAAGAVQHRWFVFPVSLVLIALGIRAGQLVEFEYNFLALEPQVSEVLLQDEVVQRFGMSTELASVTAASVEESRELAEAFAEQEVVGGVDAISNWLPPQEGRSKVEASIAELSTRVAAPREPLLPSTVGRGAFIEQLEALKSTASALERRVGSVTRAPGASPELATVGVLLGRVAGEGASLDRILVALRTGSPIERADAFVLAFEKSLGDRLRGLTAKSEALGLSSLPESLRARYYSERTGRFLVQAFPRGQIFEKAELEAFADATQSISPAVTGMPQLMLEMNATIVRDGAKATLATAIAIFLLLWLDFRRPLTALLAMLPLAAGVALMLGTMWLTGMKYNFINLIAIPIVIGIGIDDGVHVLHRYLEAGRDRLLEALSSVGRAVTVTSLSTMIGFGSIAFYAHPGMASMGTLLFIGVAGCLVATLVILPAVLPWFAPRLFAEGAPARPARAREETA